MSAATGARQVGAVVLAMAAGACWSASSEFPEHRPADYPSTRTVVLEAAFALPPLESQRFDFSIPEAAVAGSIDVFVTVDWTSPASNVVAVIGGGTCEDVNLALAGGCTAGVYLTRPSLCQAKPRIVTAQATSGAPLRLFVANTGATPESGRIQVVLCTDAPDCAAGAACGQCSLERSRVESCG
jgi:hypothetical protein